MKRLLAVLVLFAVLLVAYAIWPVYGLSQIKSAVDSRDPDALDRLVDYPELRRSLTEQIVGAYLKASGKSQQLGALGSQFATGVGATIADPMVEKLLNSKALIALFTGEQATAGMPSGTSLSIAGLKLDSAFSSGWQLFKDSEYSGGLYYVSLPPDAPADKRFRVRLRLSDWQWKLAGVGLPEDIKLRLAQEVQKNAATR